MGKIINLNEYKDSKKIEDDYLKFLSYVNKYMKIPTNLPELVRCFYFILRYLEGTVNCFSILSVIKNIPDKEVEETRNMVINYLEDIINDLKH